MKTNKEKYRGYLFGCMSLIVISVFFHKEIYEEPVFFMFISYILGNFFNN